MLVYVLGFAAKPAIAMSLPVVGITSLVGAGLHWRLGNVRVATALAFGLLAMAGAYAGARLAVLLGGAVQLALLAVVMLAAAASMLRAPARPRAAPRPDGSPRLALLAPIALAVGVLTGVVGIGGGFLVVPALVLLAGVPMHHAVGTSLLVIAMNSAAAFAGHVGTVALDWTFLARFTAAAVAGALVGAALAARVPQGALKRTFAVLLLVTGAFVLVQNRGALRGPSLGADAPTDSLPSRPLARAAAPAP